MADRPSYLDTGGDASEVPPHGSTTNTPPGTPRSRSFTRFTMRVGFEHFGQSVLLLVSIAFLRSPVLAIFAIVPISCF